VRSLPVRQRPPTAAHLYLLSRSIRETIEQSPGRRIGFAQPDWGKPLIDAALDIGFTVRKEWHQMGLLLQ
jgi:hypothetical protein